MAKDSSFSNHSERKDITLKEGNFGMVPRNPKPRHPPAPKALPARPRFASMFRRCWSNKVDRSVAFGIRGSALIDVSEKNGFLDLGPFLHFIFHEWAQQARVHPAHTSLTQSHNYPLAHSNNLKSISIHFLSFN
jgi:hypothetical protein